MRSKSLASMDTRRLGTISLISLFTTAAENKVTIHAMYTVISFPPKFTAWKVQLVVLKVSHGQLITLNNAQHDSAAPPLSPRQLEHNSMAGESNVVVFHEGRRYRRADCKDGGAVSIGRQSRTQRGEPAIYRHSTCALAIAN